MNLAYDTLATGGSTRHGTPGRVLIAMGLGAMVTFLQITATVSTLGTLQADLGVEAVTLVWIPSAYTLMVASFVLPGATIGSRFGRRRMFLLGVGGMIAGSGVIALAGSAGWVIVGQLMAGAGGALILSNSLAILGAMFADPHRRTEAITGWAAASGVGLAVGPLLAGALLQVADWHAVYVSTILLGGVTLVMTVLWVPESRSPGARIDVPGLLLSTLAVAAAVFALIEGGRSGYGSGAVLAAGLTAAAALGAFIVVERRAAQPLLDVRLFRSASFSTVILVAAVSLFGFTGVAILLVLLLERAQGLTPLETGLRMLAFLGTYVVLAAAAGPLIRRTGFKAPLGLGLVVAGLAALALAGLDPLTGFGGQWPWFVLFGIGVALVAAPATAAALASVAPAEAGMASGAVNAARQLGSALGASVLGTLTTTTMLAELPARLARRGVDPSLAAEVQAATAAGRPASLPAAREAVADALGAGVQAGLVVTGVVFLLAAAAALALVRNRPHEAR